MTGVGITAVQTCIVTGSTNPIENRLDYVFLRWCYAFADTQLVINDQKDPSLGSSQTD
jgi:hypothetical protein